MLNKIFGFLIALIFMAFQGFAQDVDNVKVTPKKNQSKEVTQADMKTCFDQTEQELDQTGHKTLKNTGAGAGAGIVIGKIIGKPGLGGVAGGAAGAYRGHKKSKEDKREFANAYASCLREEGYDVEIQEK